MLDFWLKIIAPIIAFISVGLNVFQYLRRNKLNDFEAQRQLSKLEIEGERMRARHRQEGFDLQASYEGEFRERNGIRVDFRTAEDRRRTEAQAEEHGRQWNELFTEMAYYQRTLGEEPTGVFLRTESFLHKLKRKTAAIWRALVA